MQNNKRCFVFVDVDGVLNNEIWYSSKECLEISKDDTKNEERYFDPRCVSLLNDFTDRSGAKIIVSSSWRNGRTLTELQDLFKRMGITGEVISKTPQLRFENNKKSVPRGCEIKAWLEDNKQILGDKISKVRYVILDDDNDMLWWQRNNYIQVDSFCGITYNTVEKALAILNVAVSEFH